MSRDHRRVADASRRCWSGCAAFGPPRRLPAARAARLLFLSAFFRMSPRPWRHLASGHRGRPGPAARGALRGRTSVLPPPDMGGPTFDAPRAANLPRGSEPVAEACARTDWDCPRNPTPIPVSSRDSPRRGTGARARPPDRRIPLPRRCRHAAQRRNRDTDGCLVAQRHRPGKPRISDSPRTTWFVTWAAREAHCGACCWSRRRRAWAAARRAVTLICAVGYHRTGFRLRARRDEVRRRSTT